MDRTWRAAEFISSKQNKSFEWELDILFILRPSRDEHGNNKDVPIILPNGQLSQNMNQTQLYFSFYFFIEAYVYIYLLDKTFNPQTIKQKRQT